MATLIVCAGFIVGGLLAALVKWLVLGYWRGFR